jgi:hypothetical protein
MFNRLLALLLVIIVIITSFINNFILYIKVPKIDIEQNVIFGGNKYKGNSKEDKQAMKVVMPPHPDYKKLSFVDVLTAESKALDRKPLPFSTVLRDIDRVLPYRRTPFDVKNIIHWGQLKLMLSEIQFLSEFGNLSNTVVYAGAAPGTHIKFLTHMFPNHNFILWDPRPFNVSGPRIEIHQEFFTDDSAQLYAEKGVLFISDIRSGDHVDAKSNFEGRVTSDMEWQMEWHKIMKPAMGMYKFRLPFNPGKTMYMDGDLKLQVYAPTQTTELRLIVPTEMKMKEYDNTVIEEQMYYFNRITRSQWDDQPINCCNLDQCWDCRTFVVIVKIYLINIKKLDVSDELIKEYVTNILKACSPSNKLKSPPHGLRSDNGLKFILEQRADKKVYVKDNYVKGINDYVFKEYKNIVSKIKRENPDLYIPPINMPIGLSSQKNNNKW